MTDKKYMLRRDKALSKLLVGRRLSRLFMYTDRLKIGESIYLGSIVMLFDDGGLVYFSPHHCYFNYWDSCRYIHDPSEYCIYLEEFLDVEFSNAKISTVKYLKESGVFAKIFFEDKKVISIGLSTGSSLVIWFSDRSNKAYLKLLDIQFPVHVPYRIDTTCSLSFETSQSYDSFCLNHFRYNTMHNSIDELESYWFLISFGEQKLCFLDKKERDLIFQKSNDVIKNEFFSHLANVLHEMAKMVFLIGRLEINSIFNISRLPKRFGTNKNFSPEIVGVITKAIQLIIKEEQFSKNDQISVERFRKLHKLLIEFTESNDEHP